MEALRNKANDLLATGTVQAVLAYEAGTGGSRRPCFARTNEATAKLVWDESCVANLAGYVTKPEVKRLGKLAVAVNPSGLKTLLQLQAERQIKDGEVLALVVGQDGDVLELNSAQALEDYLVSVPCRMSTKDQEMLTHLAALTREQRWAFWQHELERCIKCYACRNSCPLCYCGHCTMDCNRPQWVPVPSHSLGNLEYHMVRTMHLAGRCVECGECGRACPVGIPIHLLTFYAEASVHRQFGQQAGVSARLDYALSTFRPDDKESFIR